MANIRRIVITEIVNKMVVYGLENDTNVCQLHIRIYIFATYKLF